MTVDFVKISSPFLFVLLLGASFLHAFETGDTVEVLYMDSWWEAEIVDSGGGRYLIRYRDYDDSSNGWVGPDRSRAAAFLYFFTELPPALRKLNEE